MNKVIHLIFHTYNQKLTHLGLSVLRIAFGLSIAAHGWEKLQNFEAISNTFADPFGIGSGASLGLAIFGELCCGLAFTLGFLTRLASIPLIVTMLVAFFGAHGGSFAQGGELAFTYLIVFVTVFVTGPGCLSIDGYINQKLSTCNCH